VTVAGLAADNGIPGHPVTAAGLAADNGHSPDSR
jgi:hypothetical protein